jgi:hypothetical protein
MRMLVKMAGRYRALHRNMLGACKAVEMRFQSFVFPSKFGILMP